MSSSTVFTLHRERNASACLRQLADRIDSGDVDAAHVALALLTQKKELMTYTFGPNCDRYFEAIGMFQAASLTISQCVRRV